MKTIRLPSNRYINKIAVLGVMDAWLRENNIKPLKLFWSPAPKNAAYIEATFKDEIDAMAFTLRFTE